MNEVREARTFWSTAFCSRLGQIRNGRLSGQGPIFRTLYGRHIRRCVVRSVFSGGSGGGGKSFPRPMPGDEDGDNHGTKDKLCVVFWGWLQMLLTAITAVEISFTAKPSHALLKKKRPVKEASDVDKMVDLAWPIAKNLGFSGVLGAISAVALKSVGKSLAVVVGIFFAVTQMGAYLGYVSVDWDRVHKDVLRKLDVNQDGCFDASDFKALTASALAILAQGVPSLGGFCLGFTWGLSF